MLYEERHTTLKRGRQQYYLRHYRDSLWPKLQGEGGRILCLLTGLIGDPATQLLQITGFRDLASWQAAQDSFSTDRGEYVNSEEVRLLRPVASRPKEYVPREDRRAVYGYRRFFVAPADLPEFVHCSEDGVWPRIEAQGACILGLWATVAATTPLEVVLLTGYHGPAHWEETRADRPMPEGFDEELWERGRSLGARRNELTLRSWVRLMRATDLDWLLS